jgi:hypothetical protein
MRLVSTLRRVIPRSSFAAVALLGLAGCGQLLPGWAPARGTAARGTAAAAARPVAAGPLWDEPQFTAMLQAFRQRLPGERRALRFEIYSRDAKLEVQDPAKPANVDSYQYLDGTVSGPSPVHVATALELGGTLEENLFDLDQVTLERIPSLVQESIARTKLEGGKVEQVKVARTSPSAAAMSRQMDEEFRQREQELRQRLAGMAKGGKLESRRALTFPPLAREVQISIALEGTRQSGWLWADAKGNVTEAGAE